MTRFVSGPGWGRPERHAPSTSPASTVNGYPCNEVGQTVWNLHTTGVS